MIRSFYILAILLLLSSFQSFGQLKAKIANDHYTHLEFARCDKMYEELASKALQQKRNDDQSWEYIRRAAISNYRIYKMNESIHFFEELKKGNRLTETDREIYIMALRFEGRYAEAESLIHESASLHPSNTFFSRLKKQKDELRTLFQDSALYRIHPLDVNSGYGDFAPSYSQTGVVYVTKSENTRSIHPTYGWDNDYYLNIMEARRMNDSVLNEPKLLKNAFISKLHDGPVSFNLTFDMMVITRNSESKRSGVKHLGLYFSRLVNGEWSEPVPFKYNNEEFNVGHAVFAEEGKALYFVSDQPGGFGNADIYVSRLSSSGEWSAPVNMGPLVNTEMDELFPFVQNRTLYFASNGHFGLGGLDIYSIDLLNGTQAKNLGYPVNTAHDDFGLVIDNSGNRGFFSSNRSENTDRIYSYFKRPLRVDLNGIVVARYKENEPVPNQPVILKNLITNKLDTVITNEFGQFTSRLELNSNYLVSTEKEEFILLNNCEFSTLQVRKDSTFYCELVLKPTTIKVHLRVVEARSGKVIPIATTSVTDYAIGKDTTMMTNENGTVTITVERNKTYWAHASKKGYTDDNVAFNSANENDKVIELELKLPPIVKGDRFKLENIFYDLNKSTLRPESKIALDKLAEFIINNDLKIELSAHTDSRGSDTYNMKLSQARAQSCVDYLISKGVKKSSIVAKGYGETKLLNRCKNNVTCPEEMHQENRRTEVKIL